MSYDDAIHFPIRGLVDIHFGELPPPRSLTMSVDAKGVPYLHLIVGAPEVVHRYAAEMGSEVTIEQIPPFQHFRTTVDRQGIRLRVGCAQRLPDASAPAIEEARR